MKKFQFSLERLLRYHQQRLKQAELQVAQAAMERDSAQSAVKTCEQEIETVCRLNERVGGIIDPAIRINVTARVEQLGKILESARKRLQVAEQRFREKDDVRSDISKDVEGLSLLRQQQRLMHNDEVVRQQQIELDEVVMRKWQFKSDDDVPMDVELAK